MRRSGSFLLVALLIAMPLAGCLGGGSSEDIDASVGVKKIQAEKKSQPVYPGTYKFDGQFSQVLTEGPYQMEPLVLTKIKSKLDNADIEIGYWLPDVPEGTPVPIIVQASPYYGNLGPPISKRSGELLFLTENFVQHGYAVGAVSVRGTGDSGGCMDLMGKREVADLDQAITWLAEQPWSNGAVGMTGLSYDGSTPWSVAATGNPHLKTIVPISGVPDVYGLMFRNGSAESRGPFLLNLIYYAFFLRAWVDDIPPNEFGVYAASKTVEGAICPESWVGLGAAAYSGTMGDRDPVGWWAERNRKPLVEKNFQGSILSVQGLQDWNVDPSQVIPWVDQMNRSGVPTKQLLGQWGHAYPDMPPRICQASPGGQPDCRTNPLVRFDYAEILLHWFDYYLKGMTTVDTGPAVQVMDHTGQWRNEESFPPRDAQRRTYHLNTNGKLGDEPGAAGSVLLTPTPLVTGAGQFFRSLPGYSADFSTTPFEEDAALSGLVRLHVTVTPQGPTGHLVGYLYDVNEQGQETRIGWSQINLQFADGSETRRNIAPGTQLLVKMQFEALDAFVKKGHILRLRVWEYQEADRLPAIPPEPVTLHWGGSVKSILEVPFIERAPDAYFQPPMPEAK